MNSKIESILGSSIIDIACEAGLGEATITQTELDNSPDIIVSIGITGQVQGYFMLKGRDIHISKVIENMIRSTGMTIDEENRQEIFVEAFKELSNQISGRFIMNLSEEDINSNITPPTIIQGDNIHIELRQFPIYINLKAGFPDGSLDIEMGVKKV